MFTLDVTLAAIDSIVGHARRDAPNECCGLLLGQGMRVERAVATHNDAEAPRRRYRINAADHFALIRDVRGTDRQIVGSYHSHVHTRATPSPTDIAEAWPPPFIYLIVSLKDPARPDIRAYFIEEGKPLPLNVVTNHP
jgi:proteasome lid subunit RPN8/RPN11